MERKHPVHTRWSGGKERRGEARRGSGGREAGSIARYRYANGA